MGRTLGPGGCCCNTVAPHCPWCHAGAIAHGVTRLLFLVGSAGGGQGLACVDTEWEEAISTAMGLRSYVAAVPIVADFREDPNAATAYGHATTLAALPAGKRRQLAEETEDRVWAERLDPRAVAEVSRTLATPIRQIRALFTDPKADPALAAKYEAVLRAVEAVLTVAPDAPAAVPVARSTPFTEDPVDTAVLADAEATRDLSPAEVAKAVRRDLSAFARDVGGWAVGRPASVSSAAGWEADRRQATGVTYGRRSA